MASINKKRKKSSRAHGQSSGGHGFKKKWRGSGHRGGIGMAGTGKRADHKKSLIMNMKEKYFGGKGLQAKTKKHEVINLSQISEMSEGKKEINLKEYKILSKGELKNKVIIHAFAASKAAISKVEKAGGKIVLEDGESERVNEAPARS